MLTEEKDILVCKEFTIKLGCRSYQFFYYIVETDTQRFTSMSLDEIGEWIKLTFDLSMPQLEDIGGVCSRNAALAFKDFALEYNNNFEI